MESFVPFSKPAPADSSEVIFLDGSQQLPKPRKCWEEMETRLLAQVDEKLARPPPGLADDTTGVTSEVASKIQELRAQHQKFESWFTDVGSRFAGADIALQDQSAKMEEMQTIVPQQHLATQPFQSDFATLQKSFRHELSEPM